MTNLRFLLILAALCTTVFASCDLVDVNGPDQLKTASGTWDYGAGNNFPQSFRNAHYTVELLSDRDTLNITLSSNETDVSLWLYNPLGELVRQRWGDRTENIFAAELASGTYTIIAGTNRRGEAGNFTLDVSGNIGDINRLKSVTEEQTGDWHTNGGGNNFPQSARNHTYLFEVTENNSALDIVLVSDDTDVSLWFYNSLNELVRQRWGGRSEYVVEGANAGTYRVVVGTNARGVLDADYSINVNGCFSDMRYLPTQDTVVTSTITTGAGNNDQESAANDVYTFEVTENNSAIDIIMESPDFDISFWLIDPLGNVVRQRWGGRSHFVVETTNAGVYRLVCGTNQVGAAGSYTVSVVGVFTDFQAE